MEQSNIIKQLESIVQPYIQDEIAFQNINEETDLLNDLKINSANLVDVILDIEDVFDIEIDDDSAENMLTVKDSVAVIERLLKHK